jgi:muramidase (phage lysozyme)
MIDYDDSDFDPNTIANQDPSQWDDYSHALAIHGGIEDAVDSHIQATGQLPSADQAQTYLDQATQDQLPFMNNTAGTTPPVVSPLPMPVVDHPIKGDMVMHLPFIPPDHPVTDAPLALMAEGADTPPTGTVVTADDAQPSQGAADQTGKNIQMAANTDSLSDANNDIRNGGPSNTPQAAQPASSPTPDQQRRILALEEHLKNPNVKAFLGTIAKTEGATYNTTYGGGTFGDYAKFPGSGKHSPSGRYQITAGTYDELSRKLGLHDFSPHTQDLMAAQLLVNKGAMPDIVNGDLDATLGKVSGTWASLPQGPRMKNSYENQPYTQYNKVRSIFELNRSP